MTDARIDIEAQIDGIGGRVREERNRAGLSQRELARRLGLSPSMISQIEKGTSKPSVATLYAIVNELDVSLDSLIRGEPAPTPQREDDGNVTRLLRSGPVVRPGERQVVELDSGVRWEELSPDSEREIDFLLATYEVGGTSTPTESLMRHHGREYGYVMRGTLGIQIGFEEHTLGPGDSIAFDSTTPHRLFNKGDTPVEAIWFVSGRAADPRTED